MSIALKQLKNRLDERIANAITGGKIPTVSEITNGVEDRIYGVPSLRPTLQPSRVISSPELFNSNISALIADLSVLTQEQIDQGLQIGRQLAASGAEFRKLLTSLKTMKSEVAEFILANDVALSLGGYGTEDFSDLSGVDVARTTADVDVDESMVKLPVLKTTRISMKHLLALEGGNALTGVFPKTATQTQVGTTKLGAIFDDAINTWILKVTTHKTTDLASIDLEFDLRDLSSPDTNRKSGVEFNRLTVNSVGSSQFGLAISYKNPSTGFYTALPISGSVSGNFRTYEVLLDRVAGWLTSTAAERAKRSYITHLKLTLSKRIPDEVIGDQAIFYFMLSGIAFYRTTYKSRASLVSRSRKLNSAAASTLYNVSLAAYGLTPPRTSMDFAIAEDRYLPLYFADASGARVAPGSPVATQVVEPSGGMEYPEATGILQSHLRDWADIQGTFAFGGVEYANWEPAWRPVTPSGGDVSVAGNTTVISMDNTSTISSRGGVSSPIWSTPKTTGQPETSKGGIDFYRIAEFFDEPIPSSVELRQGKNSWMKTVETSFDVITAVITSAPIDGDEDEPSYEAEGDILQGTVRDVRSPVAPPNVFYNGEGAFPNYFVRYIGNKVWIMSNMVNAGDLINVMEDAVNFKVDYKQPTLDHIWETYFVLGEGEEGGLQVDMGGVFEAMVYAVDSSTNVISGKKKLGTDGLVAFNEVGDGFGWFHVVIKTKSSAWSPTGPSAMVTITGTPSQYAWLAPLKILRFNELTDLTKQEEHSRAAIVYAASGLNYIQDDGYASSWLAVNDPTYPQATDADDYIVLTNPNIMDGLPLDPTGIFATKDSISEFYDLSYTAITTFTDNYFVKVDLATSDPDITPSLDAYSIRTINI